MGEKVIVMQKSQFSGRLGAMRRDTKRCRTIIITTDDIIPVAEAYVYASGGSSRRWH